MANVVISYRRAESAHHAGRLHDRLVSELGALHTFIDVETIPPGVDFMDNIRSAIAGCDVLLVLIGKQWIETADDHGGRRLEDPDDPVRIEVEAALSLDKRVIPVLVGGARMPTDAQLPTGIARLAAIEASELLDARWKSDVDRLVAIIRAGDVATTWGERVQDRLMAWTGPRSYISATMMTGFPMGLAWGMCMAWLESDDPHIRYLDALTARLPTAMLVGLLFGLAMGLFIRSSTITVAFVDREQFLVRVRLAMIELTFVPVSTLPGFLVYRPSFAAGRLGGKITVYLTETRATFIGPNWYVRRIARQLR